MVKVVLMAAREAQTPLGFGVGKVLFHTGAFCARQPCDDLRLLLLSSTYRLKI